MPDNQDAVMVVIDGSTKPSAEWTAFAGDDLCARRVTWQDFNKLHVIGRKVVGVYIFQFNPSGSTPLKTEINGRPTYSVQHNPQLNKLHTTRFKPSGSGNGALRRDFNASSIGGGLSADEDWDGNIGQIPTQGVVWQDANPSGAKQTAAGAITTDQVPLQ